MQTIIGTCHTPNSVDEMCEYILDNYGIPKTIMLELSKEEYSLNSDRYFEYVAKFFEEQGSTIIFDDVPFKGDISIIKHYSGFHQFAVTSSSTASFAKLLLEVIKYYTMNFVNFFYILYIVLFKNKTRNEFMLNTFLEKKPDLTLLGNAHAKFLKNKLKDNDNIKFEYYYYCPTSERELWVYAIKESLGVVGFFMALYFAIQTIIKLI